MASEYLKWKYRDVQPDAPIELTPAQKRANWWHYHKWQIILGAVLLLCLGDILLHALGVGQIRPDVQLAYVGSAPLPEQTVSALEAGLSALCADGNSDGRVVVQVNQYVTGDSEDPERASAAAAAQVQLMADLEDCDSFLFLLEDGETFQTNYQVLAYPDGSLPKEGKKPSQKLWLDWDQCPALSGMELGGYTELVAGTEISGDSQELLSRLSVARRGFWTEQKCNNPECCEALWNNLMEGAKP